jgi:hypothetical protein
MKGHKILSHTENGYILRCRGCHSYRLAFGTSLMCLSQEEFNSFQSEIRYHSDYFPHEGFYDQKIIHIVLPCKNVCMILNYKELQQLSHMLAEVNLMQEIENILDITNE